MSRITGYEAHKIRLEFHDAHIYVNHMDAVFQQIKRAPLPFPQLSLRQHTQIENYSFDDLTLTNYRHLGRIKADMVV